MCFEKKTGGDFVLEPRKEGDRQIRILIIKDKRGEVCVCVCVVEGVPRLSSLSSELIKPTDRHLCSP